MAKRRKTNYFYSIISVALVLFLLGFFGTALLFVRQQAINQQDKITMMVELKEGADSAAIATLKTELPQMDFVNKGSVRFVSKQETADMMRQSLGDTLINPDMPLPFYDAYSLSLKPEAMNKTRMAEITQTLKDNPAVSDVYMDVGLMGEVSKMAENVALFAFIAALLFIIVALTLIHNTIRINLYSDRFIIKNMALVGASWRFITRPYIRKGIWNGFISGLIAVAMIAGLWFFIQKYTPELNLLLESPVFLGSAIVLILLGVLISWISTFYVVNKYLRMRLDDLY
jgi:cell division transport system permease protein